MPHTSIYVFDSEQKGRSQGRGIAWAATVLSKFGDLNRLVLAGLTLKSTRRASGALVVRERGRGKETPQPRPISTIGFARHRPYDRSATVDKIA